LPDTLPRERTTHRVAENVLTDVLLKYGSQSCDTPQMLESFLRKYGRACPQEVQVLTAALRCGVVSSLRSDRNTDPASLARLLVLETRVPQPQAEWAVATWSAAISNAPTKVSGIYPPEPSSPNSFIRTVFVLFVAAATGVIGYLAFQP
jgi:hypothetical protein